MLCIGRCMGVMLVRALRGFLLMLAPCRKLVVSGLVSLLFLAFLFYLPGVGDRVKK